MKVKSIATGNPLSNFISTTFTMNTQTKETKLVISLEWFWNVDDYFAKFSKVEDRQLLVGSIWINVVSSWNPNKIYPLLWTSNNQKRCVDFDS